MPVLLRPNDRWSMDFMADTFGVSRRFRILAINDDACRESLCLLGDVPSSPCLIANVFCASVSFDALALPAFGSCHASLPSQGNIKPKI